MNISQPKKSKNRRIYIIVSILVALTGAAALFAYTQNIGPFEDSNPNLDSTHTDEMQQRKSSGSDSQNQNNSYSEENPARDTQPQASDEGSSQQSSATINIPSYQASDGRILVNVAISEPWGTEALCTLEIDGPRSQTVTENVFPQAQTSGCPLEVSGLPAGSYQLTIYAENRNTRTNTQTLNVNL